MTIHTHIYLAQNITCQKLSFCVSLLTRVAQIIAATHRDL